MSKLLHGWSLIIYQDCWLLNLQMLRWAKREQHRMSFCCLHKRKCLLSLTWEPVGVETMSGTMFNVCKNTQLPEKCLFMSLVYENARLCETLYVCKGSVFYVPKTQEVDSTSIKYTHKKTFYSDSRTSKHSTQCLLCASDIKRLWHFDKQIKTMPRSRENVYVFRLDLRNVTFCETFVQQIVPMPPTRTCLLHLQVSRKCSLCSGHCQPGGLYGFAPLAT